MCGRRRRLSEPEQSRIRCSVDACPLFMFELQQRGKAAGTEAATQQERRFSPIGLQDIPVESFAGTAISGTGSVEKKVIANAS